MVVHVAVLVGAQGEMLSYESTFFRPPSPQSFQCPMPQIFSSKTWEAERVMASQLMKLSQKHMAPIQGTVMARAFRLHGTHSLTSRPGSAGGKAG